MYIKKIVGCMVALSLVGCAHSKKAVDNSVDVISTIKIYGTNTALNGTYTLNYNKKGLVTSVHSDAKNLKKAEYTYAGTNISKCVMQLENSVHTHTYSYDSKDNITKDDTKELPSISRTYQYTYNKKNQMTKMTAKRGFATTVTTYKYNSQGDVSHSDLKNVVNGKSQTYDVRDYKYDANGHFNRMTRELYTTTLSATKQTIRSTNTYDHGNLAMMKYGQYSFTFTYFTIVPTDKEACENQQEMLLTDRSLNHTSALNLIDMTWLISSDQ